MPNGDTIELLKECNAGIKTAVTSIDELIDRVKDEKLREIFVKYRADHESLGDKTHKLLNQYQDEGKEPNPMARAMSWLKINTKMLQHPNDHEVADLMMDGCNMGIKSVCMYQNKYLAANDEAKAIAKDLVDLEQDLMVHLRPYL